MGHAGPGRVDAEPSAVIDRVYFLGIMANVAIRDSPQNLLVSGFHRVCGWLYGVLWVSNLQGVHRLSFRSGLG